MKAEAAFEEVLLSGHRKEEQQNQQRLGYPAPPPMQQQPGMSGPCGAGAMPVPCDAAGPHGMSGAAGLQDPDPPILFFPFDFLAYFFFSEKKLKGNN